MSGDTECVQLLLSLKPKPEQEFFLRDLLRKGRNKLEKKRTVKVSESNVLLYVMLIKMNLRIQTNFLCMILSYETVLLK